MKTFLAAFDPYNFSLSTLHYAVELCKGNKVKLHGSFLNTFYYPNYALDKVMGHEFNVEEIINIKEEKDSQVRDMSVAKFQSACSDAGIEFTIRKDQVTPLNQLCYESMFADLMIIDRSESFPRSEVDVSAQFIKDLLAGLQCPVIVAPKFYTAIQELCILYDGSPGSLSSIRMFSYLLEQLCALPVEIFCVNEHAEDKNYLPNNLKARALITQLFSNTSFKVVWGEPKQKIREHLASKPKSTMIIMGGHQRSGLSLLFKRSLSEQLITELELPLFISNNR